MKGLAIALTALMLISMKCDAKEVTFYIGQDNDDWAINIIGKGKTVVGSTLAYSEYEYIKYTVNPKYNKNQRVKYLIFGYAYYLPNGKWDIKYSGVRHEINRTLKPGEWMTSHWIDSKIKFEGKPAKDYWLVVTIATDTGLVHAQSRKDIFQ